MREYLFRGKRIDNGEWVVGSLICSGAPDSTDLTTSIVPYKLGAYDEVPVYRVDPESVGMYTGLNDTRGLKIFEGDVLNPITTNLVEKSNVEPVEVVLGNPLCVGVTCADVVNLYDNGKDTNSNLRYEIIGNIYETYPLNKGEL